MADDLPRLGYLRSSFRWIYSLCICINQEDVLERSEQVAKMGLIYEQASSTLIWLRLATVHSGVGMEILHYFTIEKRPHSCPIWQTYP